MQFSYRKLEADNLGYLPASSLHPADTYFHFSFANYYDPERIRFGALRVLNDDDVKPHSGFDTHPHQDMEIASCKPCWHHARKYGPVIGIGIRTRVKALGCTGLFATAWLTPSGLPPLAATMRRASRSARTLQARLLYNHFGITHRSSAQ